MNNKELLKMFKEQQTTAVPSHLNDNIMIFDGLNTFIRAFGATPAVNEHGDHVGGITGFLFSVGKVVRDFKPSRCIIIFDGKGGSVQRKKMYSDYKANRANKTKFKRYDHHYATLEEEQEAMKAQFGRLINYLDCLPVTFMAIDNIEADDAIAYTANYYKKQASKITIVSTDRDFLQLVDETVKVWSPIKKKLYDVGDIRAELGMSHHNYLLYRAVIGDGADNIPGIKGIGTKTMMKLFPKIAESTEYTTDDLLEWAKQGDSKKHKLILDGIKDIERNYKLMNLKTTIINANQASKIRSILDAPVARLDRLQFQKFFYEDALWSVMKNLPNWLTNTWLSLDAYAAKK